ncbi:unnamed protein product, partial [Chrysoparadoxa australica]
MQQSKAMHEERVASALMELSAVNERVSQLEKEVVKHQEEKQAMVAELETLRQECVRLETALAELTAAKE